MLRRFSSQFKKSKDHEKENGAQAGNSKRHSKLSQQVRRKSSSSSSDDEHETKREDVSSLFDQYAQLLHASRRPLPHQNGDGTYVKHEESSSTWKDFKTLGFKDFNTLKDVVKSQASGDLVDDKTMLMERVIQVPMPTAQLSPSYC